MIFHKIAAYWMIFRWLDCQTWQLDSVEPFVKEWNLYFKVDVLQCFTNRWKFSSIFSSFDMTLVGFRKVRFFEKTIDILVYKMATNAAMTSQNSYQLRQCNRPWSGNHNEICGDSWRLSEYRPQIWNRQVQRGK